jgi:hypothetical protein
MDELSLSKKRTLILGSGSKNVAYADRFEIFEESIKL